MSARFRLWFPFVCGASLTVAAGVPPAFAQQAEPDRASTSGRLAQASRDRGDGETRPTGPCWEAHPCLQIGRILVADFRATFQHDWWRSDAPFDEDTEDIRVREIARERIGFSLKLFERVDVRMERELADTDEPWRDRYVDVRGVDALRLRAGWFRLPFSTEGLSEAADMPLALHAQSATLLAPGRDRGVMLHGSLLDRRVAYEVGRFEHDGRQTVNTAAGRVHGETTIAWRVTGRPWRPRPSGRGELVARVAYTESEIPEGLPWLTARTALDATYFSTNVFVNGAERRVGAEVSWTSQPCSASYEYLRLADDRLGESVEDTDLSPIQGEGWFVTGRCVVYGDRRETGGPRPRTLLPSRGLGFIELAGRFEHLTFGSRATGDEPATSQRADVIPGNGSRIATAGVNWHINRWVRVQWNAVREALTNPATGPVPGRSHFWNRVFRVQFLL